MNAIIEVLQPLINAVTTYYTTATDTLRTAKAAAKVGIDFMITEIETDEDNGYERELPDYEIKRSKRDIEDLKKEIADKKEAIEKIEIPDEKDESFGSPVWDKKESEDQLENLIKRLKERTDDYQDCVRDIKERKEKEEKRNKRNKAKNELRVKKLRELSELL
jgi:hypothetical protein